MVALKIRSDGSKRSSIIILHHEEDVDLTPSNIELAGLEVMLVNATSRELTLKNCLNEVKSGYDYVLIDCMLGLDMLTINALAASDSVIVPVQAQYLPAKRPKPEGGYEMVAGHRRKLASELAGKMDMPCIVRNLTDDEAIIIMVDSNLQREKILPSEKAFAYKMKLDAMKRQEGRPGRTNEKVCKGRKAE